MNRKFISVVYTLGSVIVSVCPSVRLSVCPSVRFCFFCKSPGANKATRVVTRSGLARTHHIPNSTRRSYHIQKSLDKQVKFRTSCANICIFLLILVSALVRERFFLHPESTRNQPAVRIPYASDLNTQVELRNICIFLLILVSAREELGSIPWTRLGFFLVFFWFFFGFFFNR